MTVAVSPASARLEQLSSLLLRGRALIFDVDGTLAETEELHRQAFNEAFARAGMDWHWGRTVYKDLLRVAGGKERIGAFDQSRKIGQPLLDSDIAGLHRVKTGCFAELLAKQGCPLRPGVHALISAAMARGQRLAIATTTSRENIDALLAMALGQTWSDIFEVVVAGEDVARKKPAPGAELLRIPPSPHRSDEDIEALVSALSKAGPDGNSPGGLSGDRTDQSRAGARFPPPARGLELSHPRFAALCTFLLRRYPQRKA